jgi:LysM repeat protein
MQNSLLSVAIFSAVSMVSLAHANRLQIDDVRTNTVSIAPISNGIASKMSVQEKKSEITVVPAPVVIPVPEPVTVEVASGDTLIKIAEDHQTTYQRLFDANTQIVNPNLINPGDKVKIPLPDESVAARELPQAPAVAAQTVIQKNYSSVAPVVATGSVWDQLAACESGGNWAINTGNGYYGGLQFTSATWHNVGGQDLPNENSREEQISRAEILLARSGWGQWPACTAKLGLR